MKTALFLTGLADLLLSARSDAKLGSDARDAAWLWAHAGVFLLGFACMVLAATPESSSARATPRGATVAVATGLSLTFWTVHTHYVPVYNIDAIAGLLLCVGMCLAVCIAAAGRPS